MSTNIKNTKRSQELTDPFVPIYFQERQSTKLKQEHPLGCSHL
jgi:hypothetical protein